MQKESSPPSGLPTSRRHVCRPAVGPFGPPPTGNLLGLPFLVVALGALGAGIRRLPVAYTGYAVVSLLFYLSFPVRGAPLLSLPRFVIVVFPLFVALAAASERRRSLQAVIVAIFVLGPVLLTSRFAAFAWVA
jgi:hypothetical protein